MLRFCKGGKDHVPNVVLSIVDVIGKDEIEEMQKDSRKKSV